MNTGLPYDAEIEYLESTRTQWIDTRVKPNQATTSFSLDIEFLGSFKISSQFTSSQASSFVGAKVPEDRYSINFGGDNSGQSKSLYIWFKGNNVSDGNYIIAVLDSLGRQTISYNEGIISAGDESWTTPHGTADIDDPIILLGISNKSFASYDVRLYGAKIWDSGTLVRDFIPVRVGQVGCMYDRVSKGLFGNAGTGSFVLGPDKSVPLIGLHFATEPLSAKSYVQDGLVAMWDGIENAGWGVHDANATTWKDLIGNLDFTITSGATWGANSLDKLTGTGGLASRSGSTSYSTLEFVAYRAGGNIAVLSFGNAIYNVWCGETEFENGKTSGRTGRAVGFPVGETHHVAFTFVDGYNSTSYKDGVAVPDRNSSDYYNFGFTIGGQTTGRYFNGSFYTIRLYSRSLTAEEIAHNYAIDKLRFNLPSNSN